MTGVVDVLARASDGAVLVVDYKSDRLDGAEPADVVERDYATQRIVYALAVLREGAPSVEVAYAFLERPDAPVSATFTARDIPALAERLTQLAEGRPRGPPPGRRRAPPRAVRRLPGPRDPVLVARVDDAAGAAGGLGAAQPPREQPGAPASTSAAAPSTSARSPSAPTRVSTAPDDGRIADAEIARRSGLEQHRRRRPPARRRSPRAPGSSTFTTRRHRVTDRLAGAGGPAAARARRPPCTSSTTRGTWTPSESATAAALATVSRQPRLPQRHSAPPDATVRTWPSSPAIPSRPR